MLTLVRFFFWVGYRVFLSSRNSSREGRGSGEGFCPESQRTSKQTRGWPGDLAFDFELAGGGSCIEMGVLKRWLWTNESVNS